MWYKHLITAASIRHEIMKCRICSRVPLHVCDTSCHAYVWRFYYSEPQWNMFPATQCGHKRTQRSNFIGIWGRETLKVNIISRRIANGNYLTVIIQGKRVFVNQFSRQRVYCIRNEGRNERIDENTSVYNNFARKGQSQKVVIDAFFISAKATFIYSQYHTLYMKR